jgi:hypothetical protein
VQNPQLGKLGQGRLAMRDLVQPRVQCLQVKQSPLTARVGFQDVPPVVSLCRVTRAVTRAVTQASFKLSLEVAPITKSHGSVRRVLM